MAKVIAIASGKGGTGKTTVSINLGLALKELGKDVILVDADVNTPNISIQLGAPNLRTTFHDVLEGKKGILEATYLHHSGIKIVPASISLDKANADLNKMNEIFKEFSFTNSVVILDTPPGLSREALVPIGASEETIIVTTPDLPSVTDSLKTIKKAEELGSTVVGVVLNRVKRDRLEMSVGEVEEILGANVIGVIPEDRAIRKALKMKNPLMYLYPKSKAASAFKNLASNIIGNKRGG